MHVMVDIETMGTHPNAPILSIGAVLFDCLGIAEEFYETASLHDNIDTGATMDPSTVLWWMQQSDEARAALLDAAQSDVPLQLALQNFGAFCNLSGKMIDGVWGNGASFDNVLLATAYKRLGMETPWPFWKDRCFRTMKNVCRVDHVLEGTAHNALDDARSQAQHLIKINAKLGGFL